MQAARDRRRPCRVPRRACMASARRLRHSLPARVLQRWPQALISDSSWTLPLIRTKGARPNGSPVARVCRNLCEGEGWWWASSPPVVKGRSSTAPLALLPVKPSRYVTSNRRLDWSGLLPHLWFGAEVTRSAARPGQTRGWPVRLIVGPNTDQLVVPNVATTVGGRWRTLVEVLSHVLDFDRGPSAAGAGWRRPRRRTSRRCSPTRR